MKSHKTSRCLLIVILLIGLFFIPACSSIRILPQRDEDIKVKLITNHHAHVHYPSVYREREQVVISGTLKGKRFKPRLHGHVDIALISPEGKVKNSQSVKIYRKFPFNKNYKYGYKAVIPFSSDEEIKLQIAYHSPMIQSGSFNCRNNLATEIEQTDSTL